MDRIQKQQAAASMKEKFNSANTLVVVHCSGLSAEETIDFRNKIRAGGAGVQVTKNTLAKIAANDTKFAIISDLFKGPTAIAYSEDSVAAAKVIVDFAKNNEKIKIIGGAIDGTVLDESGVKALAATPSLDQSRASIVGLLVAPATKIACLLQAPGGQVARVLNAHASK